jgi:transcriptional regulator with XRE-family HTH domain
MNKNKLLKDLKDERYRNAFVSKLIDNTIPFQIKTMRDQRGWSQEDLAKIANKKQEAISRLENPDYAKFTLKTLKELAAAFKVGLIVRFAPLSDLVKWELNLSTESLQVASYEDDLYLQEKPAQEVELRDIIAPGAIQGNSMLVNANLPATSGSGHFGPSGGNKEVSLDKYRKKRLERLAGTLNPSGQSTSPQSLMGARQ